MSLHTNIDPALLATCEKEPIHTPGAVQPFGILLTVDRKNLRIQNASENCAALFHMPASRLVGQSLQEFLAADELPAIRQYLATNDFSEQSSLVVTVQADPTSSEVSELHAHEHLGVLFLELEPVERDIARPKLPPFHRRIQAVINTLQSKKSLKDLCDAAALSIKEITGFDRVMIYRFDTDWHGIVVAEACNPDVENYLGLHFPAGDIPPQARAIFLQNWLRMIPDVDYVPSKIVPGRDPVSGAPLDLSKALLRSVSPIHLQYLRNMDVMASMTVSLIDEGKLWGLIACHHRTPLLVDIDSRSDSQLIGQWISSQLKAKVAGEDIDERTELEKLSRQLISSVEKENDLIEGLARHASLVLGVARADAGATYYKGHWTRLGNTPDISALDRIVAWLAENMPASGAFHCDDLGDRIPVANISGEIASGLLAIQLTREEKNYILWFRPEKALTVDWAGSPEKTVVRVGEQDMLHPRSSFTSWQEVVSGKSMPWKEAEIEAVEQLRNGILSLALQQELRKEQLARARAERLGLEKEEMVMVVSHDLRTPLNIVMLTFEFLKRAYSIDDPVVQRMLERGVYSTEAMKILIEEILDATKLETGRLKLALQPEDANAMARLAVNVFLPVAQEKNINLVMAWDASGHTEGSLKNDAPHMVMCERNRVQQVFSNLIGNALKFTPPKGEVIVSTRVDEGKVIFSVADTGPGIPSEDIPKVFDRFWQASETKLLGSGLGLWISKSIIEQHGGKIWASSELGVGTTFYFTLPLQSEIAH